MPVAPPSPAAPPAAVPATLPAASPPTVPVWLAGRGLVSALGGDLTQALARLREGPVTPGSFEVAAGRYVPYFGMPPSAEDWPTRARRLAVTALQDSGAMAVRDAPLLVASTSFDMGLREHGDGFELDMAAFGEQVAQWLDWRGPVFIVCTACTSALNAIISGAAMIGCGDTDHAVVLGLELANRFTVGGFDAMQLLSATSPQPLGVSRDGLVLGEAVAALRLSARPGRWRVCGGANLVDSSDPAGAAPGAVADMGRLALARSGVLPGDVGLVKLQAAGSPSNDAVEVAGLRQVFTTLPPVLSLKQWVGHTLGAAGAAEIALLTACIEADLWPRPGHAMDPTLGVEWPTAAPPDLRFVLAAILGFGGGHAAVVLEDTGAPL